MTEVDALAYAATRMPATYAALRMVFAEIDAGAFGIETVHDIGAGTGAGAWAVRDAFPGAAAAPSKVTCEERDAAMSNLGRKLTPFAAWENPSNTAADLVLLSYVLGETDDPAALARRAWDSARKLLVIVEPGTTKGFTRIAALRNAFAGASIVAPCPHALACPMQAANDWCHFAARVERTALHRQLKGGELSHEDEKFSYLILAKEPFPKPAYARIVRHPYIEPGQIQLSLCTPEGTIAPAAVRKRTQPDPFRKARKAEWGDRWQNM